MRLLALAAAMAVAAPLGAVPVIASAQDAPEEVAPATDADLSALTDKLSDPDFQDGMGEALSAVSDILLDLPVGPLIEAAEKMAGEPVSDYDRDATVRDLAGPDAERVPEEIRERVPQMMSAMSGMAEGLAVMLPALREMARDMEDRFKDIAADAS